MAKAAETPIPRQRLIWAAESSRHSCLARASRHPATSAWVMLECTAARGARCWQFRLLRLLKTTLLDYVAADPTQILRIWFQSMESLHPTRFPSHTHPLLSWLKFHVSACQSIFRSQLLSQEHFCNFNWKSTWHERPLPSATAYSPNSTFCQVGFQTTSSVLCCGVSC